MRLILRRIKRYIWRKRRKRWIVEDGRSKYGRGANSWEEAIDLANHELSSLIYNPFAHSDKLEPMNYAVFIREPDGIRHAIKMNGVRWCVAGVKKEELSTENSG